MRVTMIAAARAEMYRAARWYDRRGEEVVIVAVANLKRRPRYWRSRVE